MCCHGRAVNVAETGMSARRRKLRRGIVPSEKSELPLMWGRSLTLRTRVGDQIKDGYS